MILSPSSKSFLFSSALNLLHRCRAASQAASNCLRRLALAAGSSFIYQNQYGSDQSGRN